jgi:hypothetical protein
MLTMNAKIILRMDLKRKSDGALVLGIFHNRSGLMTKHFFPRKPSILGTNIGGKRDT